MSIWTAWRSFAQDATWSPNVEGTLESAPAQLPRQNGVLVRVAYDGTAFHGWAAQRDARTVEATLRGAILAVDARASSPRGTSRTDAGVHAEGQMAAFDAVLAIPSRAWVLALNQHLPDDMSVRAARDVPVAYQPRFSSRGKRYRYRLLLDKVRDPLLRSRAWRVGGELDLVLMQQEADSLLGTHDFEAFRASGDKRENTVRTLTRVSLERGEDPRLLSIVVEGSAFLYNMVRIIAGTLVDLGLGKRPPGTVARALTERQRALTGTTAPAHGLTLEHVFLELPSSAGEPWPH
jgi:tRNA pseudouridine38-40 synthase